MIWLILLCLSGVLFFIANDDYFKMFYCGKFLLFTISLVLICIVTIAGIMEYPKYLSEKQEIKVLEERADSIKNARYPLKGIKGVLVEGSIENINHSTVYAEYLKHVAIRKAEYERGLLLAKLYNSELLWWWIGPGAFISDKIQGL